MSADNWRKCPKCVHLREKRLSSKDREIRESYGKVSLELWEEMRAARENDATTSLGETLREDYEFFGVEDGESVTASYSASCKVCGFSTAFTYHHDLELDDD